MTVRLTSHWKIEKEPKRNQHVVKHRLSRLARHRTSSKTEREIQQDGPPTPPALQRLAYSEAEPGPAPTALQCNNLVRSTWNQLIIQLALTPPVQRNSWASTNHGRPALTGLRFSCVRAGSGSLLVPCRFYRLRLIIASLPPTLRAPANKLQVRRC